jgi:hypothetical protein
MFILKRFSILCFAALKETLKVICWFYNTMKLCNYQLAKWSEFIDSVSSYFLRWLFYFTFVADIVIYRNKENEKFFYCKYFFLHLTQYVMFKVKKKNLRNIFQIVFPLMTF